MGDIFHVGYSLSRDRMEPISSRSLGGISIYGVNNRMTFLGLFLKKKDRLNMRGHFSGILVGYSLSRDRIEPILHDL